MFKTPSPDRMPHYKELRSVKGQLVGYNCRECGRLCEAPHFNHCSLAQGAGHRGAAGKSGETVQVVIPK